MDKNVINNSPYNNIQDEKIYYSKTFNITATEDGNSLNPIAYKTTLIMTLLIRYYNCSELQAAFISNDSIKPIFLSIDNTFISAYNSVTSQIEQRTSDKNYNNEATIIFVDKDTTDVESLKNLKYSFCFVISCSDEETMFYYNSSELSEDLVLSFINNLYTLLNGITIDNSKNINTYQIVSEIEIKKIRSFNEKPKISNNQTLRDYFSDVVKNSTTDKAIVKYDGLELSLFELDKLSDYYANLILNSKSNYVGIISSDIISTVIGLFSIIKSGKCLVTINPDLPEARINYIINQCGIDKVLVCKKNFETKTALQNTDKLLIEKDISSPGEVSFKPVTINLSDPLYVIFTSGTTGNPKGVIINNNNFMTVFLWFKQYFPLESTTKSFHNLNYSFDFGLYDVLATVLSAGCLYSINKQKIRSLTEYIAFINDNNIDNICTTPSFFNIISSFRTPMQSLKHLHLGGEKVTYKMIERYRKVIPENCEIYNGYGPSECTIGNTLYKVPRKESDCYIINSVPIGSPTANSYIYILNDENQWAPLYGYGELYIGGDGLGLGYVNNEAETKSRYIPDPFDPSKKVYRSGDIGRWLPNGNIEYIDRIDNQVKINGFRIELGDIENSIIGIPEVQNAVVTVTHRGDNKNLVAFVETNSKEISSQKVKSYLTDILPQYMIPSKVIFVNSFPMTANGKVNKKELLLQSKLES